MVNPTTPNKSEGAEWERPFIQANDNMQWLSPEEEADVIGYFRSVIAHQRQQAREEGYNAGLADGTGKPLLAIEQARQQAVAEFAREVVKRKAHLPHVSFDEDVYAVYEADIRTLAKERGIDLTN